MRGFGYEGHGGDQGGEKQARVSQAGRFRMQNSADLDRKSGETPPWLRQHCSPPEHHPSPLWLMSGREEPTCYKDPQRVRLREAPLHRFPSLEHQFIRAPPTEQAPRIEYQPDSSHHSADFRLSGPPLVRSHAGWDVCSHYDVTGLCSH